MDRARTFVVDGWASRPKAAYALAAVVVCYLLYQVAVAIYNIYFHPLAKFPGPATRAGSRLVDSWTLWFGQQVPDEFALHEKYGSVVRVSPDTLSFNSGQAWKDICGYKEGRRQIQKDPKFFGIGGFGGRTLSYSDDVAHARMRKLLTHAFSDSALREQESVTAQHYETLIRQLTKEIEGPHDGRVDMLDWFQFTTFDILGHLAFGQSFNCLESASYHFWVKNMFRSVSFALYQMMAQNYALIGWMVKLMYASIPSFGETRKKHLSFSVGRVQERLAEKTDRKDFMHYWQRYNDERGMSHDEIIANSNTIIIAGSETTAAMLSGSLYFLMKTPHAYKKLQQEVFAQFKSADEMNMTTTGHLPYMHAVFQEALRRYPPVPNRLPRRTGPGGDIIDGHFVPADTSVAVAQWAAYHDARNFHDPFHFAPERWLSGKERPSEFDNDNRAAFQPFSFGPRNCLGQNLAFVEARSILARFIWHFNCELLPESEGWAERQKTFIVWEKGPLWVKLSKRVGAV